MLECMSVFACSTDTPVTLPDLERYGVTLLFCLPLSSDIDNVRRYLTVISGREMHLRNTDIVFELLNDVLMPFEGRCYSAKQVAYYFDEVA